MKEGWEDGEEGWEGGREEGRGKGGEMGGGGGRWEGSRLLYHRFCIARLAPTLQKKLKIR